MIETKVIVGGSVWSGTLPRRLRRLSKKGWRVVSTSGSPILTTVVLEREVQERE